MRTPLMPPLQTLNFLKAKKACWFVYSLFGLLTILAIFETFWFYFFANLLTMLSLNQPGQAHSATVQCALAMKHGVWRKGGENGWQEFVRPWDFQLSLARMLLLF